MTPNQKGKAEDADVIARVRTLHDNGVGIRKIVYQLQAEGFAWGERKVEKAVNEYKQEKQIGTQPEPLAPVIVTQVVPSMPVSLPVQEVPSFEPFQVPPVRMESPVQIETPVPSQAPPPSLETLKQVAESYLVPIPQSTEKEYTDYPKLEGNYLVLSDLHVPFHDAAFITKAIEIAKHYGIKKFLIAGDTMDNAAWSKHGKEEGNHDPKGDFAIACGVFSSLISHFHDGGTVIMGNHDNWYTKLHRGLMEAANLYGKFMEIKDNNVVFSSYERCHLVSGERDWYIGHGANYSGANPLGVPQKLASKFLMNVVTGHQHHHAAGFDISGEFQCIAMGGMYSPKKMGYTQKSPRTNPIQTQGFCIILDGIGYDFTQRTVDISLKKIF